MSQSKELELGKKVEAPSHYSPDSLRRVERKIERKPLMEGSPLNQPQFFGFDVWNCYEFNFLDTKGCPHNYILKVTYSADSLYIVESKSLKLYLGSFAMDEYDNLKDVLAIVETDLSNLLETHVSVEAKNVQESFEVSTLGGFENLADIISDCECNVYIHDKELLAECENTDNREFDQSVGFTELRSNCKVTHQPDYGTLYIHFRGTKIPTPNSLYQYLVSFRGENHFHEEIVETIFQDLQSKFNFTELEVGAMYTRRGGIDINPVRVLTIGGFHSSLATCMLMNKPGSIRAINQ